MSTSRFYHVSQLIICDSISNQTIKIPPPVSNAITTGKPVAIGAIVGGVVGGVGGLALILLAVLFIWRWKRQTRERTTKEDHDDILGNLERPEPFPYENSPFLPLQDVGSNSASAQQTQPLSPKSTEHLQSQEQATLPFAPSSTASAKTVSTPSVGTQSTAGLMSPADIIGLRTEVENLRRVMQVLHAERLEPPPEYVYED